MKILLVDDSPLMRRVVASLLKKLGITNVAEAGSVPEALRALQTDKPDVVISDWNMPTLTGLDLLREMRADSQSRNIPFLLLTAKGEQEDIEAARKAGVDGYLQKPFDIGVFEQEVRKAMLKRGR